MSDPALDDLTIDGDVFRVLRNAEEQHSLWPAGKPVPAGWESVHGPTDKAACLAWIDAHWTDLRPKSLRDAIAAEEAARNATA